MERSGAIASEDLTDGIMSADRTGGIVGGRCILIKFMAERLSI